MRSRLLILLSDLIRERESHQVWKLDIQPCSMCDEVQLHESRSGIPGPRGEADHSLCCVLARPSRRQASTPGLGPLGRLHTQFP